MAAAAAARSAYRKVSGIWPLVSAPSLDSGVWAVSLLRACAVNLCDALVVRGAGCGVGVTVSAYGRCQQTQTLIAVYLVRPVK